MMLDFLGWKEEGDRLREAVRAALKENFVTPDLGGEKKTVEVGDWIAERGSETSS
jgi:3-isopropylmalate dehydrogenase